MIIYTITPIKMRAIIKLTQSEKQDLKKLKSKEIKVKLPRPKGRGFPNSQVIP
jgi:hypothetical protein